MKNKLLQALADKVKMTRWSKLQKLARLPLKVLFSKWVEQVKSNRLVTADTFWGGKMNVILPEIVSSHIYRYGFFDEEVCYYMIQSLEDGGTFIDIGSHFGSFSLLASKLAGPQGRVIAIDPTPSTYKLMTENLQQFAPFKNYQTFNIALYDRTEEISFYDFGLSESAYNSIIGSRNKEVKNPENYKIKIQAQTLDDLTTQLKLKQIDFIKIDAESSELAILKGGKETLKKFSPKLTVEIGDTGLLNAPKSIEIINFLIDLGYGVFEFRDGKIVPHALQNTYDKKFLSCYNLLFVKK
jgi:FkbM family methyltransferase